MPRKNSTTWAVWNPVTSARLNQFNSDLDDLYTLGSDRLKIYRLSTDPAFQVTVWAGNYRVWTAEGQYAGGNITVSSSVTTYVMISSAGAIVTSTSGWNGQNARLGTVVSNGSWITAINIWKSDVIGWELGGGWFSNITSTTYTKGLLTSFTADAINYTLTYEGTWFNWRRMKTISNGTNTWTISYTWRFISWISKT